MKNRKITNIWRSLFFIVLIASITGCGEMLDNPTIDKDTGEDITLLIVDFNFFNTRVSYKLVDISDNSIITSPATISFSGANSNDIVNFAGEKNASYTTSEGQIELTFDPNVPVSSSSPLEFAIHVEVDGYQTLSQGIQINSEGKKTYELQMIKDTSGDDTVLDGTEDPNDDGSIIFSYLPFTKSINIEEIPYKVFFSLKKTDIVNFLDVYKQKMFADVDELDLALKNNPSNFLSIVISKNTDFAASIDRVIVDGQPQFVSFQKLETGTLKGIVVTGRRVVDLNGGTIKAICSYLDTPVPDIFGFTKFEGDSWQFNGTTQTGTNLDFTYILASASSDELCNTGSSISFSSNMVSSFSIDADIYDNAGEKIKTMTFKGNFPETFTLENVPQKSAKVIFRKNNPSFQAIPDLQIENLCSGNYDVDVEPAEGYAEYQIVLKALCSENKSIAVAPTYSGEYRIKGSDDLWQGADMIGGVANILGKPNQEYQLRLLWNEEWEITDFSTKVDFEGNIIDNNTSSKVESETLPDGRIRIKVEHVFEQSVCNDMGW